MSSSIRLKVKDGRLQRESFSFSFMMSNPEQNAAALPEIFQTSCRMTGGGSVFTISGTRVTHGFQLERKGLYAIC
jgi:hypothetical protein